MKNIQFVRAAFLFTVLLTALFACLVACQNSEIENTENTNTTLQTAQVIGIRPADSLEPEESIEIPTEAPETEPPMENEVSCLYEFFMRDININGIQKPPSEETVPPEEIVMGWSDPSEIPHTDRSALYGTTYQFRLTADIDAHQFCFRYDIIEKQLAVVITEAYIPLLLIFQVDGVDDWEEFVRIVEEDQYISATLVHARNIDIGRTWSVQAAFSWLKGIPFETTNLTPYMQYIMGYALHDSTGMIASNKHDTIERMDYIISIYGEDPT